jgi:acylphosphatase
MRSVRIVVTGRVQGVGYRAFVEGEARARGLSGWVRNRHDGSVEASLGGADEAVEAMIAAMRRGPPAARVERLDIEPEETPAAPGFAIRPTR